MTKSTRKLSGKHLIFIALLGVSLAAVIWMPSGLGPAPQVKFNTLTGESIALSSLEGKPVLITFWATSCVTCIHEIPLLKQLHETLHPDGLTIIGVAMYYDEPDSVRELTERMQLPYTIALDTDGELAKAFGDVRLTPTSYIIAPDGRIALRKIGTFDADALTERLQKLLQTT